MKTRQLITASLGFLMLLGMTPAAFAGSAGVTNSWSTRDIKNGRSDLKVNVRDDYRYKRDAYAGAWKEEKGITVITDNLDLDEGGDVCKSSYCSKPQKGGDDSTKFAEIDIYKAGSDSYATETGHGRTLTSVSVRESYDFSGFDKSHSVSADFSY